MSLTRKMLKGMGLTEEQVDSIIEEHTAVTDALKEQVNQYKKDAEGYQTAKKELEDLKSGGDDWKEKYEAEHKAFEEFKQETEASAERAKVQDAYRALLKAQNVSEKRIDKIIKLTDLDALKLTKEGRIANEEKVAEDIRNEWSDFIVSQSDRGTDVDTPPASSGKSMTKEEIMKIKDASKRQQAISENLDLFGY